jgi:hypothetical protein
MGRKNDAGKGRLGTRGGVGGGPRCEKRARDAQEEAGKGRKGQAKRTPGNHSRQIVLDAPRPPRTIRPSSEPSRRERQAARRPRLGRQ